MQDKRSDLVSEVEAGANNVEAGITTEIHHKLPLLDAVESPRQRDKVYGDPPYYAEVLHNGAPEDARSPGTSRSVAHEFSVWFIYGYEPSDTYAGSTQEAFDNIVEGLNPEGILPRLRAIGVRTVSGNSVAYDPPTGPPDTDIVPIGDRNGAAEFVHQLTFTITLKEPG